MRNKILIVDDETDIVSMLKDYFELNGYDTITAVNGLEAIQKAEKQPDIILLDINMPDIDGMEVCMRIRDFVSCPILFLTARIETSDKIKGFSVGADDYIIKPFAIEELLARIRATFRRQDIEATKKAPAKASTYRDLKLDVQNRAVVRGDEVIPLTKREFDLLNTLLSNMNQVMTREELLLQVWKYDDVIETNVVDVYIRYLRGKIDIPGKESYIQTVRGMGYVIRER